MAIVFSLFGIVGLLFVAVLTHTVVGGIVGWIVEWAMPFVPATLNQQFGTSLSGFEVGAVLGFFGSFFRSTLSSK